MDSDTNSGPRRSGARAARRVGRKPSGAPPAVVDEDDAHEQAPLLWRGDRGSDDEGDGDEGALNGQAEEEASGADDGFDQWEGLPWYKKPSVGLRLI
jgi:hypothetical protein